MPAKTNDRKKFTPAEREAYRNERIAEQRDRLEAACRELLTSDGWRRYAETRAKFHHYSRGNCLLIAHQMPEATRVAGFRKWQELGRQVKKGERALRIMGPASKKVEDVETGEERRFTYFRAVPVFDVSQTEGDPLPEAPSEPITGDSHARFLPLLGAYAESLGYTVVSDDTGSAGGYCDPKNKKIAVSIASPVNRKVRTLVHEIAHALGVDYTDYSREDAEVIVETAAWIVCGALGLDTSGESVPYVAGWGERGDLEAIKKYAEVVDDCARQIEVALELRDGNHNDGGQS